MVRSCLEDGTLLWLSPCLE